MGNFAVKKVGFFELSQKRKILEKEHNDNDKSLII